MKALILNSGLGTRMGQFTLNNHKCMVEINKNLPLIKYQIKTLHQFGITEIIITTGYMKEKLIEYVKSNISDELNISFIDNSEYFKTNYIYSIYLALEQLKDDILLLHGDLYFDKNILKDILESKQSCIVVDSTLPLPEKDFKAEIHRNQITKIATYIFNDNCLTCQPLYKLNKQDWRIWAEAINKFCMEGNTNIYAEEALNTVLNNIRLKPFDIKGRLCMEVDNPEDLELLKLKISRIEESLY